MGEALPALVGHCDRPEPREAGDECHVHVELGLAGVVLRLLGSVCLQCHCQQPLPGYDEDGHLLCHDLAGRACPGYVFAVE